MFKKSVAVLSTFALTLVSATVCASDNQPNHIVDSNDETVKLIIKETNSNTLKAWKPKTGGVKL